MSFYEDPPKAVLEVPCRVKSAQHINHHAVEWVHRIGEDQEGYNPATWHLGTLA